MLRVTLVIVIITIIADKVVSKNLWFSCSGNRLKRSDEEP